MLHIDLRKDKSTFFKVALPRSWPFFLDITIGLQLDELIGYVVNG